jgi:tRNA threonylcarbamoyladenosine biosynthesis protein TsaB
MADLTLAIDASTATGAIALLRDSHVVADVRVPMRGADGERLMPSLVELLRTSGVSTADLQRIICGGGPGGFTSLRIAAAIAKGLAEALGVELWSVSSLALVAAGALRLSERAEVVAVLDAMRSEWYAQRFRRTPDGRLDAVAPPALLGREALVALASEDEVAIVGTGVAAVPGALEGLPSVNELSRIAAGPLLHAVDVAAWEPDYGRLAEAQVKWEQTHGRALGPV